MSELSNILELMKNRKPNFSGDYFIPKLWNRCGYTDFKTDSNRKYDINVNPYDYFCYTVEKGILAYKKESNKNAELIYSTVARSTTSYDHKNKNSVENGTFIKLIMLLPLLKEFGVTILYLLPICSHGKMFMKGELGSPYATRDFYELDSILHDPLLGEFDKELLHSEFKALVEACHILGIKVVIDFAFRTVARDNVLIEKHPDWFYWIDSKIGNSFQPPEVKALPKQSAVTRDNIKYLYSNPNIKDYIKKFRLPPNQQFKEKWENASKNNKTTVQDILNDFSLVTAPGFSDTVNDAQPAWTDVTYLKYYFDYPKEISKYINKDDAPFIMQDGASLNLFHGSDKNTELWNYIIDVLPFYYNTYSIDGARIDMAHAMPPELKAEIISRIKGIDNDFILFSEEFDPENSAAAKKDGFNIISGFTYMVYKDTLKASFNKSLLDETMLNTKVPIAAAIETPDTPRSTFIFKNKSYVKMMYLLNSLLPNAVPMLNCGNELFEIQPDNLGLDNTEKGKFVLPKDDPMYGKLAFFDNYMLHWNSDSSDMLTLIKDVAKLRNNYLTILNSDNFIKIKPYLYDQMITPLLYHDKKSGEALLIVANRSLKKSYKLNLNKIVSKQLDCNSTKLDIKVIYNSKGFSDKKITSTLKVILNPIETVIIKLKKIDN